MNPDNYEFELIFTHPDGMRSRAAVRVYNKAVHEALSPLSRDRDLPAIFSLLPSVRTAREEAVLKSKIRKQLSRDIAASLTAKILELIEQRDPVNGYPAE